MSPYSGPKTEYDVIVVGGGPSGVMAAISASQLGAKTLLIERHGFLGGMTTAALVGPVMSFHAGRTQIVRGLPGRIFDRLKELGGTPGHLVDPIWGNTSMTPVDTEIYKPLLLEQVRRAGVDICLHTLVTGGGRDGERINQIEITNKEGRSQIGASYFIDASGDGDLAALLGCQFIMGRPKDGLTQPMTLIFKMAGIKTERILEAVKREPENFYLGLPLNEFLKAPRLAISGFFNEVRAGKESGEFTWDRDRILFFGLPRPDEVSVNTLRINRVLGTVAADLTKAEARLREEVPKLAAFFKQRIPGFENSFISETPTQIGVRETRHILGHYTLTAKDIYNQTRFEDVIAHACYPMDIHSPDGGGMEIVDPRAKNPESFYSIPYRCLVPIGVNNLLVTGRCISAEHEASASARISATCMVLGEAAGHAVGIARATGVKNLQDVDVRALQTSLIEAGAFLVS